MTLREIINDIEHISDDLAIFASKNDDWSLDLSAALVLTSDMERIGDKLEGLSYFLEVEIAKEVLNVWKEWRNGREPSEDERIKALLYYANYDAYLD